MTFEKQVKEAKAQQLQNRIIRDVVFLLLGIIFLAISIFSTIKKQDEKKEAKNENIKIETIFNI